MALWMPWNTWQIHLSWAFSWSWWWRRQVSRHQESASMMTQPTDQLQGTYNLYHFFDGAVFTPWNSKFLSPSWDRHPTTADRLGWWHRHIRIVFGITLDFQTWGTQPWFSDSLVHVWQPRDDLTHSWRGFFRDESIGITYELYWYNIFMLYEILSYDLWSRIVMEIHNKSYTTTSKNGKDGSMQLQFFEGTQL